MSHSGQIPFKSYVNDILGEFLRDIGFQSFKFETWDRPTFPRSVVLALSKEVEVIPFSDVVNDPGSAIAAVIDPIRKDLVASRFFQSQTSELRTQISDLEEKYKAALAECVRLQKYETHFKLSFLLTHGNESNEKD